MNASDHPPVEMPDEAMINEGGALRQPTMRDTQTAYEHICDSRHCHMPSLSQYFQSPTTLFWTGFATGVALSLLEHDANA